ncbi:lipoprotein, putative, partial [Listeria innocua FSL S4-378]
MSSVKPSLLSYFAASCCNTAKNSAPYLSRFIAPIPLTS